MRTLLLLLFSISFIQLSSQETTWYNKSWKKVKRTEASYYVPTPKKVKKGYWIVKYYKNGNKYLEGFSNNNIINNESYEGVVNYFDIDEKLSSKVNYKNGVIDGLKKVFYKTGELQSVVRYKNGKENGVFKTFNKNGKIKTRGRYKNGEKVGVWKTFYKNVY